MTLWYPQAIRRDGPAGRVSGPPQEKHGAIYHSMVGKARPQQTGNSWQFGVFKDGLVEQYYPVTAWCWHSGDRDDPGSDITNNRDLFGIEHEGGPVGNESEPLTARQLAATIELTKWALAEGHIHDLTRTGPHRGLWEHREVRATACPSERFTPIWDTIIERASAPPPDEEEDEMRNPLVLLYAEEGGAYYLSDWMTRRHITMPELTMFRYVQVPEAKVPADILDAIPVVEGT